MQFRDFRHQIEPDEEKLAKGLEAAKHRFEDNLALLQLQQPELVKQLKEFELEGDTLCVDRSGDVHILQSETMTFTWPPRLFEASYAKVCDKLAESQAKLWAAPLQHSGANILSLAATKHAPLALIYVHSLANLYASLHALDWRPALKQIQFLFQLGESIAQVENDLKELKNHGLNVEPCTVIQALQNDEDAESVWHFEQALTWSHDCDPILRVHTHKLKSLSEFQLLNTLITSLRQDPLSYDAAWTLILVGASASILRSAIHWRNVKRIILVHPNQSFANDAIQKAEDKGIELLSLNGEEDLPSKFFSSLSALKKKEQLALRIYQGGSSAELTQLRQLCELELRYLVQPTTGVQRLYQSALHTSKIAQNILTRRSRWPESKKGKVPALILGNGPSLKKLLPQLKSGAYAGYLVISCGTAISTLSKEGIIPHIHLELEYYASHLSNLANKIYDSTTFIGPLGFNHKLRALFSEQRSFVIDGHPFDEVVPRVPDDAIRVVNAFPTVVNLAAELMPKLGAKTIFFAGVDLAFKGEQHHAGGDMYEQTSLNQYTHQSGGAIEATDIHGQLIHSKREFIYSAQQLKKTINSHSQARYFSVSEGLAIGAEVVSELAPIKEDFEATITPVSRCEIEWTKLGYDCDASLYFDALNDINAAQTEEKEEKLYSLIEASNINLSQLGFAKNIGQFWTASLIASLALLILRHIENKQSLPETFEESLKNLKHLVLLYSAKI